MGILARSKIICPHCGLPVVVSVESNTGPMGVLIKAFKTRVGKLDLKRATEKVGKEKMNDGRTTTRG